MLLRSNQSSDDEYDGGGDDDDDGEDNCHGRDIDHNSPCMYVCMNPVLV